MRVYLFPLTTNRTLLYCQRPRVPTGGKQSLADKVTTKAAKLWAGWEKKDSGWQKKVVNYGNHALRRIPYEEWGLKSVPPVSARKKELELKGKEKVELIYPSSIIPTQKAESLVLRLATERQALHKKRMTWCFLGMPITIPFALVPVVPNLPFFYLVYRAWSHWRALAGGNHLEFLVKNKLFKLSPSKLLDDIYNPLLEKGEKMNLKSIEQTGSLTSEPEVAADEVVILTQDEGEDIAEALELPELEVEMERAIWQINQAKKQATKREQEKSQQADAKPEKSNKPEKDAEP
ncbi:mitochondrial K+-H+ exchange-related-domain-containing protein [Plectosphaerella plurivora]|uniref:Mitochondrial K+-H+ exchange-related-domain-containing protein n=1 Tax=Plectosphaerella plurivora TaxID=936078 RepID=A0A9P9ABH1_9PEZI|nr:mitochondrial K+-H+ exchange-related-domain-containing protein [Plectosphaerella plurivora]